VCAGQKEYCSCERDWKPGSVIAVEKVNPPICAECHLPLDTKHLGRMVVIKPIPAEKKEEKCPHGLERHYGCDRRTKPEPKPKDRIELESLQEGGVMDCNFWNRQLFTIVRNQRKILESIQRINERE